MEASRYLRELVPDIINVQDKNGWNALMLAVDNGALDDVKYLREKCSDVNAVNMEGKSALLIASSKGNIDILKYLLEKGANIESKSKTVIPLIFPVNTK
jgi:ankyrin repeat protein